jgi:hypothetical protein
MPLAFSSIPWDRPLLCVAPFAIVVRPFFRRPEMAAIPPIDFVIMVGIKKTGAMDKIADVTERPKFVIEPLSGLLAATSIILDVSSPP